MLRTAKLGLSVGLVWLAALITLSHSVALPQGLTEKDSSSLGYERKSASSRRRTTPAGMSLIQWKACSDVTTATVPAIVTKAWSNPNSVEKAYILIHGMGRDPDVALEQLLPHINHNKQLVITPGFYLPSDKGGDNFYDADNNLAWRSFEDWVGGSDAVSPKSVSCSTYDVVDSMYRQLIDETKFPNLQSVTFAGHSGGGAFVSHYALFDPTPVRSDIKVRWVHANAPVLPYVNSARPNSFTDCRNTYNVWYYGLGSGLPRYVSSKLSSPTTAFRRFLGKEVYQLIGQEDTYAKYPFGTQTCETRSQGGINRRDRGIAWWNFVNLMARTGAQNQGTYGYSELNSQLSRGRTIGVQPSRTRFRNKVCILHNVGHIDADVWGSDCGRDFLFNI